MFDALCAARYFLGINQCQSRDKYTDLSSQHFDIIDPCTTVSVVPQHACISMEQLMNV